MVAYTDGAVMAQLGAPDMRGAIAYALSHPERLPLNLPVPDFAALGRLTFEAPDLARFPCLGLAIQACRDGGTLPAVLNAANEVAVDAFLKRRLDHSGIAAVVAETLAHCGSSRPEPVTGILEADRQAREFAAAWLARR